MVWKLKDITNDQHGQTKANLIQQSIKTSYHLTMFQLESIMINILPCFVIIKANNTKDFILHVFTLPQYCVVLVLV
jgi:hypothetical protein